MTRRLFMAGIGASFLASGQEIKVSDDTSIICGEDGPDSGFWIGVRTTLDADTAIVTCLYSEKINGFNGTLLRSVDYAAPLIPDTYGLTRENFPIDKALVQIVEIKLLKSVATRRKEKYPLRQKELR